MYGRFFLGSDGENGTLKSICHIVAHWWSVSRSLLRLMWSCGVSISLYTILSSAKSRILEWTPSGMSLIYNRKNIGHRTIPCGTPDNTAAGLEAWPLTTTCWLRFPRKTLIQLLVLLVIPWCLFLCKSLVCDTLSKALLKSNIMTSVCRFMLMDLAQSPMLLINWVSHDNCLRKLCWWGYRIL